MMLGTSNHPSTVFLGKIGEIHVPPLDLEPALFSSDRSAVDHLLAIAEENLKNARIIRSIAIELLKRLGQDECRTDTLEADSVYVNLDMRFRRSARLLVELLATPDLPRKDEELADLVCVRKPSVQALRVYIHDLRAALSRVGLIGVVKCRRGKGYYIQSDDAERIMKLVG
ncbi:helix-turn-helix domain-containing protein [Novosphingobium sp. ZW T3_23]|uniref:helix-turn-helix domain-containing protein n=1 Tax=Novosphingobium sp. ZW T3_23 TaxID=3378084 RepID=UPI00385255A5